LAVPKPSPVVMCRATVPQSSELEAGGTTDPFVYFESVIEERFFSRGRGCRRSDFSLVTSPSTSWSRTRYRDGARMPMITTTNQHLDQGSRLRSFAFYRFGFEWFSRGAAILLSNVRAEHQNNAIPLCYRHLRHYRVSTNGRCSTAFCDESRGGGGDHLT